MEEAEYGKAHGGPLEAAVGTDRNSTLHFTFRTLNYGNYGSFLVMGNAGFISSTVVAQGYRVRGFRNTSR